MLRLRHHAASQHWRSRSCSRSQTAGTAARCELSKHPPTSRKSVRRAMPLQLLDVLAERLRHELVAALRARGCFWTIPSYQGAGSTTPPSDLDAEISRTGATMQPSCRWSISYALGATPIRSSGWHMLAMTFGGSAIRAFVNGSLDVRQPDPPHRSPNFTDCNERWQNPAPISTWTNRTPGMWGPGGALRSNNKTDFTVGGQRGTPCPDGVKCSGMGHPWSG